MSYIEWLLLSFILRRSVLCSIVLLVLLFLSYLELYCPSPWLELYPSLLIPVYLWMDWRVLLVLSVSTCYFILIVSNISSVSCRLVIILIIHRVPFVHCLTCNSMLTCCLLTLQCSCLTVFVFPSLSCFNVNDTFYCPSILSSGLNGVKSSSQ